MDLHERTVSVFGTATSKGQLYGGLYLLAGGVALGITALILFFLSASMKGDAYFAWREGALALGSIALTAFFIGVSIALPSKRNMRIASYIGMGLCALAIVLFMVHYPNHFNIGDNKAPGQADYTGLDVAIFAMGLAAIVAGAFTSVIGSYVQRIQSLKEDDEELAHLRDDYTIPDWAIEADLEAAQRMHGVEWGRGLNPTGRDIMQVNVGESLSKTAIVGRGKDRRVTIDAPNVIAGEQGLRRMKPGEPVLPGQWADDATAQLRAFRQKQAEQPSMYRPRVAWYLRLWDWLRGRRPHEEPAPVVRKGRV
jgi:hypothetical protein